MKRSTIGGALLAVPVVLTLAVLGWLATYPPLKPIPTYATVTSLGQENGKYDMSTAIVFRGLDGRIGEDIRPSQEVSCHVGDVVRADQIGASLHLEHMACLKPPFNPWTPRH
jgi:hypothetical protein